jgi:hypothetical protein
MLFRRFALVVLLSLGCTGYRSITGGVLSPITNSGNSLAAVVDFEQAIVFTRHMSELTAGLAFNVHGRISADVVQVAPSVALRLIFPTRYVLPMLGLGARVLTLEANQGTFGFGMMSPYADFGFLWFPGGIGEPEGGRLSLSGFAFAVNGSIGYDLRFTSQPNEAYVTASVGFAYTFDVERSSRVTGRR